MADTPTGFGFDPALSILKWPAELRPDGMQIHLQSNTSRFEAPFTRATQTQEMPGGRFQLSMSVPLPTAVEQRAARAFAARLRGSAGRFYARAEPGSGFIPAVGETEIVPTVPVSADSTRFRADGTGLRIDATVAPDVFPLVPLDGGTDPSVLVVTCLETPGTLVLSAGQFLSFDGPSGWRRLHVVVEDAVVDHGTVSIHVEPPMRERPVAGAPVHVRVPSGIFMLADDDQGAFALKPGKVADLQIDAVEAWPPTIVVTA